MRSPTRQRMGSRITHPRIAPPRLAHTRALNSCLSSSTLVPLLLSRKFLASPPPRCRGLRLTQNAARPCPSVRQPAGARNMAGTSCFQVSSECKTQRLPSISRGPAPGKRGAMAGLGSLEMGRAGGRLLTRVCRIHFLKPEVGTAEQSCGSGYLGLVSTEGGASSRAGLLGEFTGAKSRVSGDREKRARASEQTRETETVCALSVCV